jgi:hypothetical protein
MKAKIIFLVSLFICLICSPALFADEVGEVVFCSTVDDKLTPVDIKTEFDTNQIAVLFSAPPSKKFGVMELILSIYRELDEGKEELIHREKKSINPQWNTLVLKSIPLPTIGKFKFALTSLEGNEISLGTVTIKTKDVDKKIPDDNAVQGITLEDLFNKYQSKSTNSN